MPQYKLISPYVYLYVYFQVWPFSIKQPIDVLFSGEDYLSGSTPQCPEFQQQLSLDFLPGHIWWMKPIAVCLPCFRAPGLEESRAGFRSRLPQLAAAGPQTNCLSQFRFSTRWKKTVPVLIYPCCDGGAIPLGALGRQQTHKIWELPFGLTGSYILSSPFYLQNSVLTRHKS